MSTDTPRALPRALTPFRSGQYRILALALTLSVFGAGVWIVALVGQVLVLDGSPLELSVVATASAIGMLLAVLFGGALADRIPQKRILLTLEIVKTIFIGAVAVLSLAGLLDVWHLVIVALILGFTEGFFYPAYSALLPAILPPDDLLAANGFEGVLRPTVMQAAGPAVASAVIAFASPGAAFLVVACAQALAAAALVALRTTAVRRDLDASPASPVRALFGDIGGGFVYMFRTPWLLATLVFACLMILVMMGPIEVLLPFAVRDQVPAEVQAIFGGPAGAFAVVLAAFGIGGAVGSAVIASLRLPRRYLTVMILLWGIGCLPLMVLGVTGQLWVMIVAVFACGFTFSAANVIWGTLLQRRVPPEMLGRVSSLDFFVSLALMPVSMAVAGPLGVAFGLPIMFVLAGVAPAVLAIATLVIARLGRDELAHPLDHPADDDPDDDDSAEEDSLDSTTPHTG